MAAERTGTQGWQQFLAGRMRLLHEYDVARRFAKGHEVEVFHGNVAEAAFRKWLKTFLPRRYDVTSGYVVSQKSAGGDKVPHYDVVIYDAQNAPTLWVEDHAGATADGASRAIPAEHVRGVIEVKAALTPAVAQKALEHLNDLRPMMELDADGERYPKHLPRGFFCASVFFEARKDVEFQASCLDNLVPADDALRGYLGALVLRRDGTTDEAAGVIRMLSGDTAQSSTIGKGKESLLTGSPMSNSKPLATSKHLSAMLTWSEANFSMFAFDVLALLDGTYRTGFVSSFHALNWADPNRKKDA